MHPVWDATPGNEKLWSNHKVSIHASRVGCDFICFWQFFASKRFQSMHPVWDATPEAGAEYHISLVSIHASRVGCDGLEVNS